jgi:hypothetical protein
MAVKSHSAETRTRSAERAVWPERVSFAVSRRNYVKAAEAAAKATSRAAVDNFFSQPTKVRMSKLKAALHFFLYMFLCMYTAIAAVHIGTSSAVNAYIYL